MVKSVKDKGKIAVKRIPHVTSKQQRKNFQVRSIMALDTCQSVLETNRLISRR